MSNKIDLGRKLEVLRIVEDDAWEALSRGLANGGGAVPEWAQRKLEIIQLCEDLTQRMKQELALERWSNTLLPAGVATEVKRSDFTHAMPSGPNESHDQRLNSSLLD